MSSAPRCKPLMNAGMALQHRQHDLMMKCTHPTGCPCPYPTIKLSYHSAPTPGLCVSCYETFRLVLYLVLNSPFNNLDIKMCV